MHPVALCFVVAASVAGGAESLDWGVAASLSRPSQESPEDSPFAGTWVSSAAKSKQYPDHQSQRATLDFAVVGNTVTITHGSVNAGGQKESRTVVLEADGEEHPVPGQPGIVVVTTWSGRRLLRAAAKEVGATIGESVYEVSTDGKTLTTTVSGTDLSGSPFYQVTVFDRKQE
jgi:hypothetical protein